MTRDRSRKKALVLILVIGFTITAVVLGARWIDHRGDDSTLVIEKLARVDVPELSGLAVSADAGGWSFAGIGDASGNLAIGRIGSDLHVDAKIIDITDSVVKVSGFCADPYNRWCRRATGLQWEAIAIDGNGIRFLLQEKTNALVAMDSEQKLVARISLHFYPELTRLTDGKGASPKGDNSLGEGLALLRNGHLLIAKEKRPSVILEFAPTTEPRGAEKGVVDALRWGEVFAPITGDHAFEPRHVWHVKGLGKNCDLSELAVDQDGAIYVLSQVCRTIGRLEPLDRGRREVGLNGRWTLPKVLTEPEGLGVLGEGRFVVARDLKSLHVDNVVIVRERINKVNQSVTAHR